MKDSNAMITYTFLLTFCLAHIVDGKDGFLYGIYSRIIRPSSEFRMSFGITLDPGTTLDGDIVFSASLTGRPVTTSKSITPDNTRFDLVLKMPDDLTYLTTMVAVSATYHEKKIFARTLYMSFKEWDKDELYILIQTDKGIYKAGQSVNFRVMVVSIDRVVQVMPMTIEIFDGENNRVRRWENVSDSSGVYVGKMEMSDLPVLGRWSIQVQTAKASNSKAFEVKEFELPKFEVSLDFPDFVITSDLYLQGTIYTKYTFGKPVAGTAEMSLEYFVFSPLVQNYRLVNGKAFVKIPISQLKQLGNDVEPTTPAPSTSTDPGYTINKFQRNFDQRVYTIKVSVTEAVTGIVRSASTKFNLYTVNVALKFIDSNKYYKVGQTAHVEIELVNKDESKMEDHASDKFYVTSTTKGYTQSAPSGNKTIIPPRQEIIKYNNRVVVNIDKSLLTKDVTQFQTQISLYDKASNKSVASYTHYSYQYISASTKYLDIEMVEPKKGPVTIGDDVTFEVTTTDTFQEYVKYQIVSNGIISSDTEIFELTEGDTYTFTVTVEPELYPVFQALVWYYTSDDAELIADSVYVEVKQKEVNQENVTIKFAKSEVRPGDNVDLILRSDPMSSLYVLAVDKSILMLSKGNDITQAILPKKDPINRYYQGSSNGAILSNAAISYFNQHLHLDPDDIISTANPGSSLHAPSSVQSSVAFYSSGVFATSTPASSFIDDGDVRVPFAEIPTRKQETVRMLFPDTWLFTNTTADSNGLATIDAKVPDTVTTWIANCFSVSSKSVLSPAKDTAELKVLLPFFVSLQLPFSVIRQEHVVLQANIFNYHTEDLYIMVSLKNSRRFKTLHGVRQGKKITVEEKSGHMNRCILVKAGESAGAFFPIVPTRLGEIPITITADSDLFKDTVTKRLLVKPEGLEKSVAYPILIDHSEGRTFNKTLKLAFPPNTVEDSERIRLTLFGDMMGPTIEGLDDLVQMPYGCGEQNMIVMAPSVFVVKYLTSVGRLNPDLRMTADRYMTEGIQRELKFRHNDGSYSAWGGDIGSTWLTSFVVKVFSIATPYVFVDDSIITTAVTMLIKTQKSDGSYTEFGYVSSQYMQGGSGKSTVRMTAYVLIAIREARRASKYVKFSSDTLGEMDNSIKMAVQFLDNNINNQTSKYTVAIVAYALTLTKASGADKALAKLETMATQKAGLIYWEEKDEIPVSSIHLGSSTRPISIEMSAYALLTFVLNGDLGKALKVQKWLVAQRNAHGGFVSTQDTVIGLQALAEFSAAVKSSRTNMKIKVTYVDSRNHTKKFKITKANSLIMQTADLSTDTTELTVQSVGNKGNMALLTISLFYNVNIDLEARRFDFSINVTNEDVNGFTVKSCVSWLGKDSSGMVVVEIGIPSGFSANTFGISKHDLLKKIEIGERQVVLYYDEITLAVVCTSIPVTRDTMVANSKPVPCRVYEYYEPSNAMTIFYAPLTAKNSNICDICGRDCGCARKKGSNYVSKKQCRRKMN